MSGQEDLVKLLHLVATGDREAYAHLYSKVSAKLFGVALRILKRRDLAEEALQEGLLKIWNRAGDYRPDRGSPMTWMISIVRNGSIDSLRQARPETSQVDIKEIASSVDAAASPFDWAASSAEARRLRACLDQLGERQRSCVVLAYVEGYTHQELASRFDCPLGTVKSWIRRSLFQLKTCLEQ